MCGFVALSQAQQPFLTDDADVTDKGKFHFEITNEFDQLQLSYLPIKYQNAARTTLAYGLLENVEVSVSGQFLTLFADQSPRIVGFGDTSFAAKYNFRKEREDSRLPALALSGFVQIPTGSASRSLGSGKFDFGANFIAQKTFREKNVFRANTGIIFSGNTLTGVLGISDVRGQVFTGGASYVREINDRLHLGTEITVAAANNFLLSKSQLQTQFGGNYQINKKTTLDFGIIAGRFAASPRFGFQIGFSRDF